MRETLYNQELANTLGSDERNSEGKYEKPQKWEIVWRLTFFVLS